MIKSQAAQILGQIAISLTEPKIFFTQKNTRDMFIFEAPVRMAP